MQDASDQGGDIGTAHGPQSKAIQAFLEKFRLSLASECLRGISGRQWVGVPRWAWHGPEYLLQSVGRIIRQPFGPLRGRPLLWVLLMNEPVTIHPKVLAAIRKGAKL